MASGNHISCGPCMFDDVTKDAGRWCTNCEEGLCEDCENLHRKSKASRNHKVITIEDYRKIENVSISQVCEHHGENLEWFCKSHDEALCVVCVPSKHKTCSDVIPISVNSENSRQSTALSDLEETIEGTLRNVNQCIKSRETATKEIERQELEVKTMVLETRKKINGHLDKLQEKLIHELTSTAHTCKSKYIKICQKLKSTEEMLTKIREETEHMKQFSSDIQVFLGTRQVNKRIIHEVESMKREIGAAKDYELKVSIDSLIEKFSNDVEDFGNIMVSESAINLDFRDPKIDEAQIEIDVPTSRNISEIKLQLIKSFQLKSTDKLDITGCVMLPSGNLLMANDTEENKLIEYSETGEHIRDSQVSGKPFDIAVIDHNLIVVTYGNDAFLEIMHIDNFKVERKIVLQKSCMGVSQDDGRLYIISGFETIQVLNLSGIQLETLRIASNSVLNIATSRHKILYTDYRTNKVHCCRKNGEELWQLQCKYVTVPSGVMIDNDHNVYVVGYGSNNLTVIQHNGKNFKAILTTLDGLLDPYAVSYDKDKRTLLVCSKDGKVALYKIV